MQLEIHLVVTSLYQLQHYHFSLQVFSAITLLYHSSQSLYYSDMFLPLLKKMVLEVHSLKLHCFKLCHLTAHGCYQASTLALHSLPSRLEMYGCHFLANGMIFISKHRIILNVRFQVIGTFSGRSLRKTRH